VFGKLRRKGTRFAQDQRHACRLSDNQYRTELSRPQHAFDVIGDSLCPVRHSNDAVCHGVDGGAVL
jgi:hypothetical protein